MTSLLERALLKAVIVSLANAAGLASSELLEVNLCGRLEGQALEILLELSALPHTG